MLKIKYIPSKDARSLDFNKFVDINFPNFYTEENPDLILVSGGDGAMLHAIHEYRHYGCPFFGNAAGTLNFLMNKISDPKHFIEQLLQEKAKLNYLDIQLINVYLKKHESDLTLVGTAVNEVVIGSHLMGYHEFSIDSKDGSFDDFHIKGSGISVSTDLGSTGYNFNLGAPVIPLGSNLWVVCGIVCNRFLRDILNPDRLVIKTVNLKEPIGVFVDSILIDLNIIKGDEVILETGDSIKIAFIQKTDFLQRRVDITSRYRKQ